MPATDEGHRAIISTLIAMRALASFALGAVAVARMLHFEAVGFSLATVGLLMAVYSVGSGLSEVPSGALADRWGRRRTKLAASALLIASLLLLAVPSAWVVAVGFGLTFQARALGSGAAESWFVDEIGDPDHPDVLRGISLAEVGQNVGIAAGAIVGGLVPVLFAGRLADDRVFVPVFAIATLAVAAEMALTFFRMQVSPTAVPQPAADRTSLGRTLVDGMRLTVTATAARWALIAMATVGALNACLELLTPIALADFHGRERAAAIFGVVVAVSWILGAPTSALAPWLERRTGSLTRGAAGCMAAVSIVVALSGSANWRLVVAGYLAYNVLIGPVPPLLSTVVHRHVDSDHRSTAISTFQLCFLIGATAGSGLVALVGRGAPVLMLVAGLAAAFGLTRVSPSPRADNTTLPAAAQPA